MIQKQLKKLVGLPIGDFQEFRKSGQIHARPARLIPTYKAGDEMALTSIFLSSIRLVKEFREGIFKDLKLPRGGKVHYFTEVSFPEIDSSRFDGLLIVVKSGVINDAAVFEMKNKKGLIENSQIETYLKVCATLKIPRLITVSNQFVADHTQSPIDVKTPKSVNLFHFSWTYLLTRGRLLLFKNDINIEDEDQVEIMKEVISYLENPISGVLGIHRMKPAWKDLVDQIKMGVTVDPKSKIVTEALYSWYEEEKDMALMLSRRLGQLVKSTPRTTKSHESEIQRLAKDRVIHGILDIRNAVSPISIVNHFSRRTVSMSVRVAPPEDKKNRGKATWILKQLEYCQKKSSDGFNKIKTQLWIDIDLKFARNHIRVRPEDLSARCAESEKEVQAFNIGITIDFGSNFSSLKKFVDLIEEMAITYYGSVVQHLKNWQKPAPKLEKPTQISTESDLETPMEPLQS